MAERKTYDWSPGVVLSQVQVAYYAYRAGFRGDDLWKAVAIAGRESGYKPGIHGSESPQASVSGDRGLFQINYVNDAGLMRQGIYTDPKQLFDPLTNARAAYALYKGAGNSFAPAWSVGAGGWNGTGDPLTGTSRHQDGARAAAAQITANPNTIPTGTTPGGVGSGGGGGGGGTTPGPGFWGGVGDFLNPFDEITDLASAVMAIVRRLIDPRTWVRVLYAMGGLALIGMGLATMVGPEAVKLTPTAAMTGAS